MNQMTPEIEKEVSQLSRLSHIASALMYRKKGDRVRMNQERLLAKCEKLKQMYFIGPCPF